jgi:hypothetical protein
MRRLPTINCFGCGSSANGFTLQELLEDGWTRRKLTYSPPGSLGTRTHTAHFCGPDCEDHTLERFGIASSEGAQAEKLMRGA